MRIRPSNGIIWPTHKRKALHRKRTRKTTARPARDLDTTTGPDTSLPTP